MFEPVYKNDEPPPNGSVGGGLLGRHSFVRLFDRGEKPFEALSCLIQNVLRLHLQIG